MAKKRDRRDYCRQWYLRNKDRVKARMAAKKVADPAYYAENARRYRRAHPEYLARQAQQKRKRRIDHPEHEREMGRLASRRINRKRAVAGLPDELIEMRLTLLEFRSKSRREAHA